MPQIQDKSAINRMLATHGLGTLESGTGLLQQLGYLVDDHDHLMSLLSRCEPEMRVSMYNSLTPYVRFKAKPLDVYLSAAADLAQRQQLPTIDAEGNIKEAAAPYDTAKYDPDELQRRKDTAIAQEVVSGAFSKFHLAMKCRSCTKEEVFDGETKAEAVFFARRAGWVYYEHEGASREICPDCPAVRKVQ